MTWGAFTWIFWVRNSFFRLFQHHMKVLERQRLKTEVHICGTMQEVCFFLKTCTFFNISQLLGDNLEPLRKTGQDRKLCWKRNNFRTLFFICIVRGQMIQKVASSHTTFISLFTVSLSAPLWLSEAPYCRHTGSCWESVSLFMQWMPMNCCNW